MNAFDTSGPSRVIASAPEMRRKPVSPIRINRYHPPVRGAEASAADNAKTARILGRPNTARTQ